MFESKANEGVFMGYSSVSKAIKVFSLSRKTIEESNHVNLDEGSFIHDRIYYLSSILSELTSSSLDPIHELLWNIVEPVVSNIDLIINSHSDTKDEAVVSKEAEPSKFSNQEDSILNNVNDNTN